MVDNRASDYRAMSDYVSDYAGGIKSLFYMAYYYYYLIIGIIGHVFWNNSPIMRVT